MVILVNDDDDCYYDVEARLCSCLRWFGLVCYATIWLRVVWCGCVCVVVLLYCAMMCVLWDWEERGAQLLEHTGNKGMKRSSRSGGWRWSDQG